MKNIFAFIWAIECLDTFHENIERALVEGENACISVEQLVVQEVFSLAQVLEKAAELMNGRSRNNPSGIEPSSAFIVM